MRDVTRRGLALSGSLAFVAGYVDAIGFIRTGGLFVSFMSGNSTQAGVEAVAGGASAVVLPVVLVVAFVVGVTLAGVVVMRGGDRRAGVVGGAGLAIGVVVVLDLLGVRSPWSYVLVAAAMGALNTLYLADGRARVAITYATGTLVSLGLALAALLTGGSRTAWRRPLLLWGSLAVGALAGAAAHAVGTVPALTAAAVMLLVLAALLALRGNAARA